MTSLYSRLFAYRERSGRSPKEDYLTEALADLLARLPKEKLLDFVVKLLLPQGYGTQVAWAHIAMKEVGWRVSSQETIRYAGKLGRLDIILHSGSASPSIIIENKIAAGFGMHDLSAIGLADAAEGECPEGPVTNKVDATNEIVDQLAFYSLWLAERRRDSTWPGAVCLLTHSTAAPQGFGTVDRQGVRLPFQHVCQWHQVCSWLENETRSVRNASREPWQIFAGELGQYLREERMSAESVTDYDLAACQLFLKSGDRFKALFERIWTEIDAQRQAIGITQGILRQTYSSRGPFVFDSAGGVIWDWFYLFPPLYGNGTQKNWYIGWGLRYPEQSSWWENCDPPLPRSTHWFVVWQSEVKPLVPQMQQADLPLDWIALPDGGAITARALKTFNTEQDSFSTEISAWIAENTIALLPVIRRVIGHNTPEK